MKEEVYNLLVGTTNITDQIPSSRIIYGYLDPNSQNEHKDWIVFNTSIAQYYREMTGQIWGRQYRIEITIISDSLSKLYTVSDNVQSAINGQYVTETEDTAEPFWNVDFQWFELPFTFFVDK